MHNMIKLALLLLASLASSFAVAQQIGGQYQVQWGTFAVPFSPWLGVAIALMLLAATHAFLRRHAKRGLFMLATATLAGALSLSTDKIANAVAVYYSITSSPGSQVYDCNNPGFDGYQNDTGSPLTLTITPIVQITKFSTAQASPAVTNISSIGSQQLAPGQACIMACAAG